MSSKSITIVLGMLAVLAFSYIAYGDAVRTWQHLQSQNKDIENLTKKQKIIESELDKTIETKEKNQAEVLQLETEKQKLEQERQKLEKKLRASVHRKAEG